MLSAKHLAEPWQPRTSSLPAVNLRSLARELSSLFLLPLNCKRSTVKRWNCIFTRSVTRAVHVEIARSMEASSFISALRRSITRQDKPVVIGSDNGTNFTAGDRELRAAVQAWDSFHRLHRHPPKTADKYDIKKFFERNAGFEETLSYQPEFHKSPVKPANTNVTK